MRLLARLASTLPMLMLVSVAKAAEITVGGAAGWDLGITYQPIKATVGDVLVFNYASGQHNVFEIPIGSCSALTTGSQLAGLTQSPARVTLSTGGTHYYACSVSGHCPAGMLLTVNVSPPTGAPSPSSSATAPAFGPASDPGQGSLLLADTGFCEDPAPSDTYPGAEVVTCYSPGIPMEPGQVINDIFVLPNPYPTDAQVAIVVQTLQLVDDAHRPVPLSEVYVHHVFGSFRFLPGEGAELRGSRSLPPLPEPYALVVDGIDYVDPVMRISNIHLIQTSGVRAYNIPPCIECWCQDDKITGPGYLGGTACCADSNCPVTATPATNGSTYFIQFNITYRPMPADITPSQTYMMDIMGGNVEYDILRIHRIGQTSIKRLTGPFDGRCPQTTPFQLLRCTGHLHIGGKCLRLIDDASGQIICSSCATYGSSPSVDDPGNEYGYLVKMDSVDLVPPYTLFPGQNVTMEAEYDANTDHFGVMSLFFNIVAGFNESCPGTAIGPAGVFGPTVSRDTLGGLNAFSLFEGKGAFM